MMTFDDMFCVSMTLNVQYDGLCIDDSNAKNDILWFCDSMLLEWKIWYMMTLYLDDPWMWNMINDGFDSMALDCEIWYWVYITLKSINSKDNIVPRWPLNEC
jgi:hypothetical protein